MTLIPHVLPTPEPGLPPYSAGARLPRTRARRERSGPRPRPLLSRRRAARARGAERRARARRPAAARPRARRHLAPAGADRDLPPARVPARRLAALACGSPGRCCGSGPTATPSPRRATTRSCWWRRAPRRTPSQRMLRAALEGAGRTSRCGCWPPPTAARRRSRCRCPANARLVDWLSYAKAMPALRRGRLPRRPRHRGARAGERRADRRLPGRRRHGRERRPRGLGGRRRLPAPPPGHAARPAAGGAEAAVGRGLRGAARASWPPGPASTTGRDCRGGSSSRSRRRRGELRGWDSNPQPIG